MSTVTEQLELELNAAKSLADMGNAVKRLMKNRDFKKVILEKYFEKEPVRLVFLKGDANWSSPESQQELLSQMDAIGNFRNFLNSLMLLGDQAEGAISAYHEEIADSEAEEDAE